MKKSKFTETQIVSALKEADARVPIKDICRQMGISMATYYQWKWTAPQFQAYREPFLGRFCEVARVGSMRDRYALRR
jgi:hypothetical protein